MSRMGHETSVTMAVPDGACEVCWGMAGDGLLDTGEPIGLAEYVVPTDTGRLMPICADCAQLEAWADEGITPVRLAAKARAKRERTKERTAAICQLYEQAKDALSVAWASRDDRTQAGEARLRAEHAAELARLQTERNVALADQGLMVVACYPEPESNVYTITLAPLAVTSEDC